ncbi:MAG: hypothetical protein V2A73_00740 [Pseudomonadota bacterium]
MRRIDEQHCGGNEEGPAGATARGSACAFEGALRALVREEVAQALVQAVREAVALEIAREIRPLVERIRAWRQLHIPLSDNYISRLLPQVPVGPSPP